MDRRYLIATVGVLILFSFGLVGYYLVSDGVPDGLDKTLEENGTGEDGEPVWNAPLDYGSNYQTSLIMGIVGFVTTLVVILAIIKLRKTIRSA